MSQKKKKDPKSFLKFQEKHLQQFGLKVTARDAGTSRVSSVCCRFCIVFGREEKVGSKCKQTANVKYYSHFRTDHYGKHLIEAHPKKWAEYQALTSEEDRGGFFQVPEKFLEKIPAHFEGGDVIRFLVNKPIVEVIIGELLFHPDDFENVTHARALSLFKPLEEAGISSDVVLDEDTSDAYVAEVNGSKRFSLLVGCVALGASFRMAAKMVKLVRDESGLSYYSGCTDVMAANYVRVASAYCLQALHDCLKESTGMSLALDSSTHQGMSYLDIRVRFTLSGAVQNFHLLAIPLYSNHTGEYMFEVLVKFMDALYKPWKEILIGVSSDGARSMTGKFQGLVTRLGHCAEGKLIRVWCGLHQLDLVMQEVFRAALDDKFHSTLTALIGHLRRQQNLIAEMRSTCPKVADTRWLSMFSVTKWLASNIRKVQEHLERKNPACKPTSSWWIFLFAINALAKESSFVFTSLQGLTTQLSQQKGKLTGLVDTLCRMTGMEGPLQEAQLAELDSSEYSICGRFAFSHEAARLCLESLDLYVINSLDLLEGDEVRALAKAVADIFVQSASGISSIVCERDSQNQPTQDTDALPPVLPHQLVKLDMRAFSRIFTDHLPRLEKRLPKERVHEIGREFVQLCRDYREEEHFKRALDTCNDAETDFFTGWKAGYAGKFFPNLARFCGDLATVFPNTATVESDFSILGWEKDDYRTSLTDFSLEGIFHSKQFSSLRKLMGHDDKSKG